MDTMGRKILAQAVIFGLGSMFNHSTQDQNVVWERDASRLIITYRASRDIHEGEELCKCITYDTGVVEPIAAGISYGSHLTFKDADRPPPTAPEDEIEKIYQIQFD